MVDTREGDNRPARYEELIPGTQLSRVVYRASALGGACTYELAQMREGLTGEPPPGWMMEKFEQGHTLEPRLRELLTNPDTRDGLAHKSLTDKSGAQYMVRLDETCSQDEIELELMADNGSGQSVVVRGHIDDAGWVSRIGGPGMLSNTPCVVEYKALGESFYRAFLRKGIEFKESYAWQATTYGYGANPDDVTGAGDVWTPVLFICGLKNADGTDIIDWSCVYLAEPPRTLAALKARVRMIEMGLVKGCKEPVFPCSMYRFEGNLCHKETRVAVKAAQDAEAGVEPPTDVSELAVEHRQQMYSLRDHYATAKAAEKEAKDAYDTATANRKDVEAMIHTLLDDAGKRAVVDGAWTFEWVQDEPRAGYTVEPTTRSYLKVKSPKPTRQSERAAKDPFTGVNGD